MENNDSNNKSPQTGGLKLMTVFIAVLALHVVVIGGFTVYHLMTGSADVDMTMDKSPKKIDIAAAPVDNTMAPEAPKAITPDASMPPAPVSADAATTTPGPMVADVPSNTPAPIPAATPEVTPAPIQTTVPKPAPATTVTTTTTPKPITSIVSAPMPMHVPLKTTPPPALVLTPNTTPSSITSLAPEPKLSLANPAPIAPLTTTPIASMPINPGPVHMPTPSVSHPASTHDVAAAHPTDTLSKKETYTVKMTDSFKKIAKSHHITVAQLKDANNIKGDTLHTGQKLLIPVSKGSLAKNDASSTATVAAKPTGTSSQHHTYTVEKGDTLAYIAKKFNTTKTALIAANELPTSAKLTPGKKLKIPAAKETRSAAATAPAYVPAKRIAPIAPMAPVAPTPAPVAQPAPTPQPVASQPYSPQPAVTPELANMTF